jgi:glutamate-1-semialdehyde 2,1-aminomutase
MLNSIVCGNVDTARRVRTTPVCGGIMMKFDNSNALRKRSHALIPGGAHTYAKGDDQYPQLSPGFIERGKGCHVWDVDGNEFIEYGMGLRAVGLGHGYEPVVQAAYEAMKNGTNFTRPGAIELKAAEAMLALIPNGEMIKFAKNGSDVTTAAVKLARAVTGRELVAICAEQPFYSVDDWFIGASPMTAGIPVSQRALTVKFHYNDIESLCRLFEQYPNQIACIIMEAETTTPPAPGYLQQVIDTAHQHGALFILDENITGFRWHNGGAQTHYGITPDLSTFGKAMANGFAMGALVGKREYMERGGLQHPHQRVFLLSTTHGGETHALAACIATTKVYQSEPVVEHMFRQGDKLRAGITQAAEAAGVSEYFGVMGRSCNLIYYTRDMQKQPSQAFRALFMQETIARGLILPSLVDSYAHSDADIQQTIDAIGDALHVYRRALDDGVEQHLVGAPVKPVFRMFN